LVPNRVEPESCRSNRNANGNHVISIAEESVGLHIFSSSPGTFAKQIGLHGYPFEPYLDLRLPPMQSCFGSDFSLGLQLCLLMMVALQEVGSAQPA